MFVTVMKKGTVDSVFIDNIGNVKVNIFKVEDDDGDRYCGRLFLKEELIHFDIKKSEVGEENFTDEMIVAFQTGLIGMIQSFMENKPKETLFYPLMLDNMLTKEFFDTEILTLKNQLFDNEKPDEEK